VIAPRRIADTLDGGHDDRHVLGLAAGHHRVDRDLLRRDGHHPVRDEGDLLLRGEPGRLEHRADPLRRGRHDRKTVGPALCEAELDRVADVLDLVPASM